MSIESGAEPPQHALPLMPDAASSLIDVHGRGMNVTLQPFAIADPVQALLSVLSVPTFVASQYTSQTPLHTLVAAYVLIPTWPTHVDAPLHVTCCATAWKFCPFVELHEYWFVLHGLPFQQPLAVSPESVLNAARCPEGTHPIEHLPLLQYGVIPPHATPQPPQFALSESTSMHEPPQYICPAGQQ